MHNQATKHLRCRRWIALGALATGLAAATSPVQADTFLYLPYLSATVTDPIAAVGQLGGSLRDIEAAGRYAFLGIGPRVVILDLDDPSAPRRIGASRVHQAGVVDVEFHDRALWIALRNGVLARWDVIDPHRPGPSETVAADFDGPFVIAFRGDVMYRAGRHRLRVDRVTGGTIRPLSEVRTPGSTTDIAFGDGFFVVQYTNGDDQPGGFAVYVDTDGGTPRLVADVVLASLQRHVAVSGTRLAITSGSTAYVYDLSRPEQPVLASIISDRDESEAHPGVRIETIEASTTADVAFSGNSLWVGAYEYGSEPGGLWSFDVDARGRVRPMGSIVGADVAMIELAGDFVLAGSTSKLGYVSIIDVARPEAMSIGARFEHVGSSQRVWWMGDTVLLGSEALWAVDVGEPGEPRLIGTLPFDPWDIRFVGEGEVWTYVSRWAGERFERVLSRWDVRDSATVREVTSSVLSGTVGDGVRGRHGLYFYGSENGSERGRRTGYWFVDPEAEDTEPRFVETGLTSYASATVGDVLFLGGTERSASKLAIMSLKPDGGFEPLAEIDVEWDYKSDYVGWLVADERLLIVGRRCEVRIYDVTDPTRPLELTSGPWIPWESRWTACGGQGVLMSGNWLIVSEGGVWDISDPRRPVRVDDFYLGSSIALRDGVLATASSSNGLTIYEWRGER